MSNEPEYRPEYEVQGEGCHVDVDYRHVGADEAHEALDEVIGQGSPATAPDAELPDDDHDEWAGHDRLPSRKWFARTATALGGLATTWATTDGWDEEETLFLITIIVGAIVSYVLPNNEES